MVLATERKQGVVVLSGGGRDETVGLRVGRQESECLAAAQGSHSSEVPLVKRRDVQGAQSFGKGHQRSIREPEPGICVSLGDLHRRRDRARPPLEEICARSKIGTERAERFPATTRSDKMVDLRNDHRRRREIVMCIIDPSSDGLVVVVGRVHVRDMTDVSTTITARRSLTGQDARPHELPGPGDLRILRVREA